MRHRSTTRRLDQTVTRAHLRLGTLAGLVLLVAIPVNLTRTALASQANTYIAADEALAQAHAGMLDEETGLRAFLETRQASYLAAYNLGQGEIAQGVATLQDDIGTDGVLFDDYVAFRLVQNEWLTKWASVATTPQPVGTLPGFVADGKVLFDRYRVGDSTLDNALHGKIVDIQALANRVAIAAVGLEFVVLLAAVTVWSRGRRELRRAIVGPVSTILGDLERLEAGDFTVIRPLSAGPSELRAISDRLVGLAGKLESARDGVVQREQEATEHAARLRLIVDMGREIAGSLNLHYVLQAVADSVVGFGDFDRCTIWLTDETSGILVAVHDSTGVKGRVVGLDNVAIGEQAIGKAARFGRVIGPEQVSHLGAGIPWGLAIAVPMIVGARVVGVLELGVDRDGLPPLHVMEIIDTLSSQAATAIEAARLYEMAEQRGKTDALTLLPNRRDLDRSLDAEVSRAQRYHRPLAVAMIDIDHFKVVNDTEGHARGDEVLQDTAALMRALLRDVDTIFRYGGEEFLVIMPETGSLAAVELCDRLRVAVSERVTLRSRVPLTISCGVAAFPNDGNDGARLVAAADDALYRAKRGGRNQVVIAAVPVAITVDPLAITLETHPA